ncbi:hypothetical protein V6N11_040443 [Hibiscus sabdariffa]|uniref:RNase H type-1 domain-containing protein n=1 Tax=Hibiscus sabdariffa TaxID=183260 RepID=A0ABR2RHH3_9ROSI
MDIKGWILLDLTEPARVTINPKDWDLFFGLISWNIWLRRNVTVFGNPLEDHGTVLDRSKRMLNQYALAFTSASKHSEQSRDKCLQPRVPTILLHVRTSRDWIVQYHQILRAKNRLAHSLAKMVCRSNLDTLYFHHPPSSLVNVEQEPNMV